MTWIRNLSKKFLFYTSRITSIGSIDGQYRWQSYVYFAYSNSLYGKLLTKHAWPTVLVLYRQCLQILIQFKNRKAIITNKQMQIVVRETSLVLFSTLHRNCFERMYSEIDHHQKYEERVWTSPSTFITAQNIDCENN